MSADIWDGIERRTGFCPAHDFKVDEFSNRLKSLSKKLDQMKKEATPRWVFVLILSGICVLALIFASWHVNSLKEMRIEQRERFEIFRREYDRTLSRIRSSYNNSLQNINKEIEQINNESKSIRDLQIKIRTIQEDVLEEIEEIQIKQELRNGKIKQFNFESKNNP